MVDDPELQTGTVYVRYADGREYEVTTAALADQYHPDAEIVRYFDGRRFVRSHDASIQAAQAEADKQRTKAAKADKAKAE